MGGFSGHKIQWKMDVKFSTRTSRTVTVSDVCQGGLKLHSLLEIDFAGA